MTEERDLIRRLTKAKNTTLPTGALWGLCDEAASALEARADLIRRLAYGLDAALPHLDAAAAKEKRAEEGKNLREITKQQSAEMARKAVNEAFDLLGLDG